MRRQAPRRAACLWGAVVATVFTLLLNAPTIAAIAGGELTVAHLGADPKAIDETYYFALISDSAEGHLNLGNASLKEHQSAPAVSSYAPLLQGLTMRLLQWDLLPVVVGGDLLFPWLGAFFFFVALSVVLRSPILAALATLVVMREGGIGWLRSVTPQISFVVVAAYLAALVGTPRSLRQGLLRGFLVSAMVYVQPIHASYFLVVEVVEVFCRLLRKTSSLLSDLRQLSVTAFLVISSVVLKGTLFYGADPVPLADTYRRLGLVESPFPAAPFLQVAIAAVLFCFFLVRRRTPFRDREVLDRLLPLPIAGLLVLNQSLIHGRDAVFGLYYGGLLRPLLWVAGGALVACLVSSHHLRRVVAFSVIASLSLATFVVDIPARRESQRVASRVYALSGAAPVLTWLQREPPERVVLAPSPIAELIPPLTSHYVAFSRYARFQYVSDAELADRYLLQESFFPTPVHERDETYNVVFGLSAGNLAARERTACRVRSLFRKSIEECRVSIRSRVLHRELLPRLDRGVIDQVAALRVFHVDLIVTQQSLPRSVAGMCPLERHVGAYAVHRCRSAS